MRNRNTVNDRKGAFGTVTYYSVSVSVTFGVFSVRPMGRDLRWRRDRRVGRWEHCDRRLQRRGWRGERHGEYQFRSDIREPDIGRH
jgi:hypothetical protein